MRAKQSRLIDGVPHWRCPGCSEWLPSNRFFRTSRTVNGLTSRCRGCHTAASIRTRDAERKREANRTHMRRARAKAPEKFRERYRVASAKRHHGIEAAARAALNAAVRRGDIQRPAKCSGCGEARKVTGHHSDYRRPLDVEWLCYPCHGRRHRRAA